MRLFDWDSESRKKEIEMGKPCSIYNQVGTSSPFVSADAARLYTCLASNAEPKHLPFHPSCFIATSATPLHFYAYALLFNLRVGRGRSRYTYFSLGQWESWGDALAVYHNTESRSHSNLQIFLYKNPSLRGPITCGIGIQSYPTFNEMTPKEKTDWKKSIERKLENHSHPGRERQPTPLLTQTGLWYLGSPYRLESCHGSICVTLANTNTESRGPSNSLRSLTLMGSIYDLTLEYTCLAMVEVEWC